MVISSNILIFIDILHIFKVIGEPIIRSFLVKEGLISIEIDDALLGYTGDHGPTTYRYLVVEHFYEVLVVNLRRSFLCLRSRNTYSLIPCSYKTH